MSSDDPGLAHHDIGGGQTPADAIRRDHRRNQILRHMCRSRPPQCARDADCRKAPTLVQNLTTGNRTRELSAPIIQQNLNAVGIQTELVSADFNSTLSILQDSTREYDGVLMGSTFRPGQYSNNHWWERFQNDRLVALSDAFNSTVDPGALTQNVGDWLREVNDQVIRVWLYIPNEGFAIGPRVTQHAAHPYEPFGAVHRWTVDAQ